MLNFEEIISIDNDYEIYERNNLYGIFYNNKRILLQLNNNTNNTNNTNKNLLIICESPSKSTDNYLKRISDNKSDIIKIITKIQNKNNYTNIIIINLSIDYNINVNILNKIVNIDSNINILFASGCKTHNYKNILIWFKLNLHPFYEKNLVKCFWILNNNNPCNIVQRAPNKNKINDIINNNYFNEYTFYRL